MKNENGMIGLHFIPNSPFSVPRFPGCLQNRHSIAKQRIRPYGHSIRNFVQRMPVTPRSTHQLVARNVPSLSLIAVGNPN